MLKINNTKLKKLKIPLILSAIGIGGIFLYQYLTFIPEYSHAESISTKPETPTPNLPNIEGTITTKFGTEAQGYKTYMQEIDLKYCQSLPEKTTGQLADGRDGKIYWVTVLGTGDDKTCWMTQDLDLDLGPNGPALKLANDGDNLYKGTTLDKKTQTEWTGGVSVDSAESGWVSGSSDYNQIKWWGRNSGSYANGDHKAEHTFLGNLYSYEAATAGTGHTVTGSKAEVPGSICPAGWKLPISGNLNGLGSFSSLGMSSRTVTKDPYYYQYGGYISGSLYNVGSNGYYWSATSSNSDSAYNLYFDTSGIFDIGRSNNRYYGYSVRCVVRDPNYTAPTVPTPSDTDIKDPNISVTVPNIITLSIDNKSIDIDTSTSNPAEGTFTATVTANNQYKIALNTTEGSNINLVNTTNPSHYIPALSTDNSVTISSDKWWGIKCNPENNTTKQTCNKPDYTGITLNPETYFTSTTGTPTTGTSTPFTIGIQISPDLPSGTYSSSITVTASSPN